MPAAIPSGAWIQEQRLALDFQRATKETAWRDPSPHGCSSCHPRSLPSSLALQDENAHKAKKSRWAKGEGVTITPTISVRARGEEQKVSGILAYPILKNFFDSVSNESRRAAPAPGYPGPVQLRS